MGLNRRAHPVNHRGAGYSARILAFSFTLLIAAGPWLPLSAQENAPVRHARLVDSIRTSQGLLSIRVDLHRGIVYSLADSGGMIVESPTFDAEHVDEWATNAVLLLGPPILRPAARPTSLRNVLLFGRAANSNEYVLLISDGTREAGVPMDTVLAGRLLGSSLGAVMAARALTDDELRGDTQIRFRGATIRTRSRTGPEYPPQYREASTPGEVVVQFAVDENGRAVRNSIRFLFHSAPEFAESVRRWLVQLRFNPAEVEGRSLTHTVILPVSFTIN